MSFFENAVSTTIHKGEFNYVAGNQTIVRHEHQESSTVKDIGKELIPRGNIFLLTEIGRDTHLEAKTITANENIVPSEGDDPKVLKYTQTTYHARVVGFGDFTSFCVVKYGGKHAHEAFRHDLGLHLSDTTWHPNILQLFGVNSRLPALIFHDHNIPLEVFTGSGCFRVSPLSLWYVKCRLLNDFLTMKDLPIAHISDDLEILKHDFGLEMTVCSIPNLWVQPANGHICIMPSSRIYRDPVCSWYVLKTGLGESELGLVPPVPLKAYHNDRELVHRVETEVDVLSLLAREKQVIIAGNETLGRKVEFGDIVFFESVETMRIVGRFNLERRGVVNVQDLQTDRLCTAWLSQAHHVLRLLQIRPAEFSSVRLCTALFTGSKRPSIQLVHWTAEVYASVRCYLVAKGFKPDTLDYSHAHGYPIVQMFPGTQFP
ncbi:hypothetical protein L218DRAFT_1009680 [Marasmius fiardii PR-910]|nr:hypothetical protein L218DRAFT_1009680 [Marasmius fiardii PR-910]